MSSPSEPRRSRRAIFRPAGPGDAAAILGILEEEPSPGPVELTYTRRPDPVASILREGRSAWLLVARDRDGEGEPPVGLAACTLHEVWIGGEPATAGYLFALRVARARRRLLPLLPEGYRLLLDHLRPLGPRLHYTTILADNTDAMRLLEKDRPSMPRYEPLTRLGTFALFPRWFRRGPHLRRATDARALAEFLAAEGSRQDLFPRWSAEALSAGQECPSVADFRVWEEGGRIVAATALWDQRAWRQHRVVRYHGLLRGLHRLGRLLPGLPRLPDPGTDLPLRSLSACAVKDGDPERLRAFLMALQADFPRRTLAVAAAPLGSDAASVLASLTRIRYDSQVYQVRDRHDPSPQARPERPLYLEIGRL